MFSITYLHVISDWFLNTCHKILHFLQPVKSKTIGIGNFKDIFLKITLPEKLLMVLFTNGHISKKKKKKKKKEEYEHDSGIS